MSSDCVLFWRLAGPFYFNTIGVFSLVHRLTFFEPRHYGGVFGIQKAVWVQAHTADTYHEPDSRKSHKVVV